MRAPIITVVVLALAGCGGDKKPTASTPTPVPAEATRTPAAIAIAPEDRDACTLLYARLSRITSAVASSSELVAHSLDKQQLSRRIAIEEVQLRRSARLMAAGPTPAPLAPANRRLVAALRALSRDFARARTPAARGDFAAAAQAMSDPPLVQRIVRASQTIEDACK